MVLLTIAAALGCGGVGTSSPSGPACPTTPDWSIQYVDDVLCVTSPFVGETLGVAHGGALPLGTSVEILAVDPRSVEGGISDQRVTVRGPDGDVVVRSRTLTPWYGDVFLEDREADVPFALGLTVDGPVLAVGDDTLALELPPRVDGPVEMDVGRWGDDQPLFDIRVGIDAVPPFAAVTHDGQGLRQLSVPTAHEHAPELGEDEPDCEAAKPIGRLPGLASPVRDLEVPSYAGEPPGPVHCETRGRVAEGRFIVCSRGPREVGFVERSTTRWDRLYCGSDPLLELDRSLQFAGVTVVEDVNFSWTP